MDSVRRNWKNLSIKLPLEILVISIKWPPSSFSTDSRCRPRHTLADRRRVFSPRLPDRGNVNNREVPGTS